jgi:hypothetical protein
MNGIADKASGFLQSLPQFKDGFLNDRLLKEIKTEFEEYICYTFQRYEPDRIPRLEVTLFETREAFQINTGRGSDPPFYFNGRGDGLQIKICIHPLMAMDRLAVQGWLDQMISEWVFSLHPERTAINFNRQIHPLFPVSGSGINIIRFLLECLINGQRGNLISRQLIAPDHALPRLYFLQHLLDASSEEFPDYQMFRPYLWTRASFICRKLFLYLSLSALCRRDIAFSAFLNKLWWKRHHFLDPKDKEFLKRMAGISEEREEGPFAETMIEMFKLVRAAYLHRNL